MFYKELSAKTLIGVVELQNVLYFYWTQRGSMQYKESFQENCGTRVWGIFRILSLIFLSDIPGSKNVSTCDICFRAKQTCKSFSNSSNNASIIVYLVHCDAWVAYITTICQSNHNFNCHHRFYCGHLKLSWYLINVAYSMSE